MDLIPGRGEKMNAVSNGKSRDAWIALALSACVFYLFFITRTIQQKGDSLGYALCIRNGTDLFHPHHILYNGLVRLIYLGLKGLSLPVDAVLAAQLHNLFWAAAAVAALYFLLRMLFSGRKIAILGTVTFAVFQGFWVFATQVDVYIPALACLMILTCLLFRYRDSEITTGRIIWTAFWFALAVLYHQMNLLFAVPMITWFYAHDRWKGLKILSAVFLLSGAAVLLFYVFGFYLMAGRWDFTWFVKYCLSYTQNKHPDWGSTAHLGPGGILSLIKSQIWNFTVTSGRLRLYLVLVIPLAVAAGAGHLFHVLKRTFWVRERVFLLLWTAVYLLFYLWWLPTYRELFVITLFPLFLLLLMFLKAPWPGMEIRNPRLRLAGTGLWMIIILLLVTTHFRVVWTLHSEPGQPFMEARRMSVIAPDECVLMAGYFEIQNARYYFNREAYQYPHLYFYRHMPLPEKLKNTAGKCLALRINAVMPDYQVFEFTGITHPAEYWDWLKWLFHLGPASQEGGFRCRIFYSISSGQNDHFLVVDNSIHHMDQLSDFFRFMDDAADADGQNARNTFYHWFLSHRTMVESDMKCGREHQAAGTDTERK